MYCTDVRLYQMRTAVANGIALFQRLVIFHLFFDIHKISVYIICYIFKRYMMNA